VLRAQLLEFLLIPHFLLLSPAFPVLYYPLPGCQQRGCWILLIPRTPLRSEPDTVLPVVRALVLLLLPRLMRLLLIGSVANVGLFSLSPASGYDWHSALCTFRAKADKTYTNCCRNYSSREERRVISKIRVFETNFRFSKI
jgi:hypothetical protein